MLKNLGVALAEASKEKGRAPFGDRPLAKS